MVSVCSHVLLRFGMRVEAHIAATGSYHFYEYTCTTIFMHTTVAATQGPYYITDIIVSFN